jgi:hypothetical protein
VKPHLEALEGSFAGETHSPPDNTRNRVCGHQVVKYEFKYCHSIDTESGAEWIKIRKLQKTESRAI